MKMNSSKIMLDKFLDASNKQVEIWLKNGKMIKGEIVGYYKEDDEEDELNISHWHVSEHSDSMPLGIDPFGNQNGIIIKHYQIKKIKFLEDETIIDC
jgi:hypothetical protein